MSNGGKSGLRFDYSDTPPWTPFVCQFLVLLQTSSHNSLSHLWGGGESLVFRQKQNGVGGMK